MAEKKPPPKKTTPKPKAVRNYGVVPRRDNAGRHTRRAWESMDHVAKRSRQVFRYEAKKGIHIRGLGYQGGGQKKERKKEKDKRNERGGGVAVAGAARGIFWLH